MAQGTVVFSLETELAPGRDPRWVVVRRVDGVEVARQSYGYGYEARDAALAEASAINDAGGSAMIVDTDQRERETARAWGPAASDRAVLRWQVGSLQHMLRMVDGDLRKVLIAANEVVRAIEQDTRPKQSCIRTIKAVVRKRADMDRELRNATQAQR
jgi:hypothetical protein